MSAAKFGILALVLGTPFGLAVYSDFIAPAPVSARAAGELQEQVDELQDQVDSARAEAEASARAKAAQDQLMARLADHPTVVPAAALRGIDGIDVTDGLMVDGKGEYDAGTFLELANPDGTLRSSLIARWGLPIRAPDDNGQLRWFWFDEPAKVRVMLVEDGLDDRNALELRPYTPLEPLLHEAADYLGKSARTLPVTDATTSPVEMVRPPSEYSDAATRLQLWTEHGTVTRVVIFADVLYLPGFFFDVEARLTQERSKPTVTPTDDGGMRYDFPGRPPLRVDLDSSGEAMTFQLGRLDPPRP